MKPLDVRRAEAMARNSAYRDLTPEQKLSSLDARGLVAQRQRKKLRKTYAQQLIDESKVVLAVPAGVVLTTEDRAPKPRHKKGKRGGGRRSR